MCILLPPNTLRRISNESFFVRGRSLARTYLGLWGLCTGLIRTNLQAYLDTESRGLVYVLKSGLCAEFQIVPPVLDFSALDAFLSDELRTEARFGFVRIDGVRQLACSSAASQALLLTVLQIADQAELTRRLKLGMHRLTQAEYDAIMQGAMGEAK
ncbi:MAG: hypothetical protein HY281_01700 [Nitrospirae bacterium]|nr:hypothetical protein [Nitrospirota bacterium]